jgi:2-dehydropantoate 2-reductase
MKIAVIGAGAMGSIFGARFAESGHDVVLVDVADPLVTKLNADGVTIRAKDGSERVVQVKATTEPASVGTVDVVVFFTKCYHTASAAAAARPLVGADTVVASLQNGWGNGDVLAGVFGAEQVVVGVTYNSATVLGLAHVSHPGVGPTLVGPFEGESTAGADRIAGAIAASGLEVEVVPAVRTEIWTKLILNAATLPTASLTGMNAGALTAHAGMRELVSETAREATAVARALGYEIDAEERISYIHGLLERAGPTKGSMLQDFEAGRQTEIDVINGAVVRAATDTGVPAPLNEAFVSLVKGWESMRGLGT